MEQLTERVFVDVGVARPNPSFVVTDDGVLMVDSPELPQDAIAWREEMSKHGSLQYLVNLEHHADHIIGNFFYSPPAIIISHRGTREAFGTGIVSSAEKVRERNAVLDPAGVPIPDDYELRPPTVTYTERMNIYLGQHEFQLHNLPGHTPNQTVLYVPQEGVMMAGGNLSCEIMPAMWGGMNVQWLDSLDRMIAMEPEYIVPVHGPIADLDYLIKFRGLIASWIGEVRDAIASGWSKEEAASRIDYLGEFRMRPGKESYAQDWQAWNTVALYEELNGEERTKRVYFKPERYPKEALGR